MNLVWAISGWVVAGIALAIALWSLVGDRSRGRRRCPKCWYDMAGVTGLRCPECGRESRNEKQLFKSRRRPAWLLLSSLTLLGSYFVVHIPRIQEAGSVGAIPTSALIWWVARNEPPEKYNSTTQSMSKPTPAAAELARRLGRGELWSWQMCWTLRAVGIIRSRDRWPRGVPFVISTGVPQWLSVAVNRQRLEVRSEPDGAVNPYPDHILPWSIRTLAKDEDHVDLSVHFSPWSCAWRLNVRQVDTPEQAIDAVKGAEVDAAVRRALAASLRVDNNKQTNSRYLLGARLYRDRGPIPESLAVDVTVEFRRDGEAIASWPLLMQDSPYGEPVDWIRIDAPGPGWNEDDPADMARWTVTVRGDAAVAIKDLTRDSYWSGEWTVPLTEFMGKAITSR